MRLTDIGNCGKKPLLDSRLDQQRNHGPYHMRYRTRSVSETRRLYGGLLTEKCVSWRNFHVVTQFEGHEQVFRLSEQCYRKTFANLLFVSWDVVIIQ